MWNNCDLPSGTDFFQAHVRQKRTCAALTCTKVMQVASKEFHMFISSVLQGIVRN